MRVDWRALRLLVALFPLLLLVSPSRDAGAADSFGQSLLFSSVGGSFGHVEVAHAADLNPGTAMTIEAWIKPANVNDCPTIMSKDYAAGSFWFGICHLDNLGSNRLAFNSNGTVSALYGVTAIPANVWTHVAVVWSAGGTTSFYINGDLDVARPAGPAPAATTRPLWIGKSPSAAPFPFTGYIAEARIWNVARSQSDIRELLSIASQEKLPGLVAVWNFADDLRDEVGEHHGTAQGGASSPSFQPGAPPPRPMLVPIDTQFLAAAGQPSVAVGGAGMAAIPELNRLILAGGGADGAFTDQVLAVDSGNGTVRRLAGKLPAGRSGATAAYAPERGLVYLFGGTPTFLSTSSDGAVLAVNPSDGTTRVVGASVPTMNGAAVYHAPSGKIWIFGGSQGGEIFTPTSQNTIWVFDPATETVTTASFTLPVATNSLSIGASRLSGKIYLMGSGLLGAPPATRDIIEVTANADGSGSIRTSPAKLPIANFSQSIVEDPISGQLYILGGFGTFASNRVLAFDPLAEQIWETSILLPEARERAGAIYDVKARHALMVGGSTGGLKNTIWRIPLGDGAAVPVGRWDFPFTLANAVNSIHGDGNRVAFSTTGRTYHLWDENKLVRNETTIRDIKMLRWDPQLRRLWILQSDRASYADYSHPSGFGSFGAVSPPDYNNVDVTGNSITTFDLAPVAFAASGVRNDYRFEPIFGGYLRSGFEPIEYDSRINLSLFNNAFAQTGQYWYTTGQTGNSYFIDSMAHRDLNSMTYTQRNRSSGQVFLRLMDYFGFLRPGGPGDSVPTTRNLGQLCGTGANAFQGANTMAWGPNNDLWVASVGSGSVNYPNTMPGSGICRVLNIPDAPTFQLVDPGNKSASYQVSVDLDGRVWVTRDHGPILPGGGLSVFQSVPSTAELRTGDFNWLNAPIGSKSHLAGEGGWVSPYTAVGAVDERVWLGGDAGRVATIAQRWAQVDRANDIRNKTIDKVFHARGKTFLADATSGLYVLQPDGVSWDNRTGVRVRALRGDRRGRVWVGTDGDVRRFTPTGWDLLAGVTGIPPAGATRALAEDALGRIWIGGDAGLTLFDRERFVATFTSANSTLPATPVTALVVDRDDRLWVGTASGLARLNGGVFQVFTTANGLPSNNVHDLTLLGDGRVVVNTAAGSAILNAEGTAFVLESSVANAPLDVDQAGTLWIGPHHRNPGGYQSYYWTNSGLRHSTVSDVAADQADRVWFAHAPNTGVSVRGSYLPPLPEVVPTISGISPDSGRTGDLVTISGAGFGTAAGELEVRVGSQLVELVGSPSPTQLVVRIGPEVTSGDVVVKRLRRSSSFSPGTRPAFCAIPTITGYTPTGGNFYVEMAITGANFDPSSQIALGGPLRGGIGSTPLRRDTRIQPGDASGNVVVRNTTAGCPGHEATAANFVVVQLQLQAIDINQGLPSTPLVGSKPSLLRSYVSSPNRRPSDVVRIGSIDVVERDPATGATTSPYVLSIPAGATVSTTVAAPSPTDLLNISLSLNVPFFPNAFPEKRVVLKNGPYTLAERTQSFNFLPGDTHTLLLVPILPTNISAADRASFKKSVDDYLGHVEQRMMPFGYLRADWSGYAIFRSAPINIGSAAVSDLNDMLKINGELALVRKAWHRTVGGSGAYVAGIIHPNLQAPGDTAIGASWTPPVNNVYGEFEAPSCDLVAPEVQLVELPLTGLGDKCKLDMQNTTFVSAAIGGGIDANGIPTSTVSRVIAHELGHSLGLVSTTASNYAADLGAGTSRDRHSKYDELDGGECSDAGSTYNHQLTLYSNDFAVREPVVNPLNPITLTQLFPNASAPVYPGSLTARGIVTRAKATLSYACARRDMNLFFDPIDFQSARQNYLLYPNVGRPGTSVQPLSSRPLAVEVTPKLILGERISIGGIITPAVEAGALTDVRAMGPDAYLSPDYLGDYSIVQVDAAGTVLTQIGLMALQPHIHLNEPARRQGDLFTTTIVRARGVAAIQLRKGDTVLASFAAGGAAPSITLTSPTGGSFTSGALPVAWTANDPDGDPVQVMVEYSRDGAKWELFGLGSAVGSLDIPVALLGGSPTALVRVIASDGFHSTTAVSPPFAVSNQPPEPFISSPGVGGGALESRPVELIGGARDNQDGRVAPAGLIWSSNRDGPLGTGDRLARTLSAGKHVISLAAINSAGLSTTTTREIVVAGDYDGDGVSDAEDLSRSLGLSPLDGADVFRDAGGLPMIVKIQRGLDPAKSDTDGDGRSDAVELVQGTDPRTTDSPPSTTDQLTASPTTVAFSYDRAKAVPPQDMISLLSRAPADWSVTSSASWLAAVRLGGRTLDGVQIYADPRALAVGTYTATLTFSSNELGSTSTVQVTLTVTDSTPPGGGPGPNPIPPSYFFMPGMPVNIPYSD